MPGLAAHQESQARAVDLLRQALATGRMHHAYLLAGPADTRPESLAVAFAAVLVCSARVDGDACGACPGCRKLAGGNHPDVLRLTPDEKGNIPIDAVRELSARLALRAVEAPTKVAIIDRAEAMRPPAQNALLKTLEEPPGPTCFLLTTARPRQLLATVRSRCLLVRLAPRRWQGAWQQLVAAGIPEEVARPLAGLSAEPETARELLERGAAEVVGQLRCALAAEATLGELLAAAADLASNRERAELATALLELEVRDALASSHAVAAELLYDRPLLGAAQRARLPAAVDLLHELRRRRAFNLNQTYALETLLLTITGRLRPAQGAGSQDADHEPRSGAR